MKKLRLLLPLAALSFAGCMKNPEAIPDSATSATSEAARSDKGNQLKGFKQVNLVASTAEYAPLHLDPALVNGWGIAFSATGTPWVSSQAGHVSTVYNSEGTTVLGPVHIPSPGGPEGGNPTGIIFNAVATDFVIPSGNATPPTGARFIFVGVDGIVSGWNGSQGTHAYSKFNNSSSSAYTGLAIAANGTANMLYAANFRARKIDVWDASWNPVSMKFKDPWLPWGYSPFNIQAINGQLYVTYAKVGADGESEAGVGKGLVSIFRPDGKFVARFATRDKLNAPWGITLAPASFFPANMDWDDDDDHGQHGNDDHYRHGHNNSPQPAILVGNFGDGRINAYTVKGKFLGQLKAGHKKIVIEGLWALSFAPTTSTVDPNRLYFAAGPDEETAGLFGYLIKD